MSQRRGRVNPLQSVIVQGQRSEEWGTGSHGMHSRSKVVQEPRQSQRERARRAAGLRFRFEDVNLQTGLSENDGR